MGDTDHVTRGRTWQAHEMAFLADAPHSGVVAIAVQGNLVATGGSDSSATIWSFPEADRKAGATLERRMGGVHGGAVTAIAAHAPSNSAITSGEDGVLRFWSSTEDYEFPAHGRDGHATRAVVNCLGYDSRHGRICTGSADSIVRIWDVSAKAPTGRFLHTCAGPSACESIEHGLPRADHSPRGVRKSLPMMKDDVFSEVFNVQAPPMTRRKRRFGVLSVAFDVVEACTQLASGSSDGSWHLWDTRERSAVVVQPNAHESDIASVALEGLRLITVSLEGSTSLWDCRNCASPLETCTFIGLRPHAFQPICASRSSSRVALQ